MGCDIHLHIEVQIDDVWHHYAHPYIQRNYTLFGLMAGVRDTSIRPICLPRGLPADMSVPTRIDYYGFCGGHPWAHSSSWFGLPEIVELEDRIHEAIPVLSGAWWSIEKDFFGCYLFGSSFGSPLKYPSDYTFDGSEYRREKSRIHDVRLVFWFDN